MKKLFSIILFFISINVFGQYPVQQNLGSDSTLVNSKGAIRSKFINFTFTDTTQANTYHIDEYPGSQIFTSSDESFWYRNSVATKWLRMVPNNNTNDPCNYLVPDGGFVSWNRALVFYVTPAIFYINCTRYTSGQDSVTLDPADATNPRIDVIAVNTSGDVVVVKGLANPNPQTPQVNPSTQLYLTSVLIPANATVPSCVDAGTPPTNKILYDEATGSEWNVGSVGFGTLDPINTQHPFSYTVSIILRPFTNGNILSFNDPNNVTINSNEYSLFIMHIRLKAALSNTANIQIGMGNNRVSGNYVTLGTQYGFDKSIVNQYQTISIPISAFSLPSPLVSAVSVYFTGSSSDSTFVDLVEFQKTCIPVQVNPNRNFVTSTYKKAGTDSVFYVVNGVSYFSHVDASGGSTINIITDSSIVICSNGNNLCDTTVINNVGALQTVTIVNDSTLVVCGASSCDTLHISPPQSFNAGIVADNGLTAITPTHIQLGSINTIGSPLLHKTYINAGSLYSLNVTGSTPFVTNSALLTSVNTSVTGGAIYGESSQGGRGVYGVTATGVGVYGLASGSLGIGVFGNATTGQGGYFQSVTGTSIEGIVAPSSTNTIVPVLKLNRVTSSTSATGIGGSIEFYNELSDNINYLSNTIISKNTNVTPASRVSQLIIQGVNAAVTADLFTLSGSGALQLNKYGINTFAGSPAYSLGVDASGNVIEFTSSGGGFVTANNGLTASSATNVQFGGTLIQTTTLDINSRFFYLFGTNTDGALTSGLINVENSDQGTAFYSKTSGTDVAGVAGEAALGFGVYGYGKTGIYGSAGVISSGVGVYGTASSSGVAAQFVVNGDNSSVDNAIKIEKNASVSGLSNGVGVSLDFLVTTTSPAQRISNQIISKWATVANATRTSSLTFTGVTSATTQNWLVLSSGGGVQFSQFGAGALSTDGSGNVTATSDIRLKNVRGEYKAGLQEILSLHPIIYNWNKESGYDMKDIYAGFSAQEVKRFLPYSTGTMKNGYLTLQDRAIIAALVNSIQELKLLNDNQQKEINKLKLKQ